VRKWFQAFAFKWVNLYRYTTDDVLLRVHLPARPVGVARIESVYADGPCKNMAAGAGFPVILVGGCETSWLLFLAIKNHMFDDSSARVL
jgi:hypothetical protein